MSNSESQKTPEDIDVKIKKEEEEQKKLIEAINKLPSDSIKSKSILLYDLNEDMKSQYFDKYKEEKIQIELEENRIFLDYLNKIRDFVNTSLNINSCVDNNDEAKYSLVMDDNNEFTTII